MPRRSSLVISGSKFNYFGVPLISPTLNFQLTLLFSGSFDDSITPLMVTEPPFPISTLPPLPFLVISNYSFHNRVKLSRYNDQPSRLLICLIRVIFRFNFEYTKKKKKKKFARSIRGIFFSRFEREHRIQTVNTKLEIRRGESRRGREKSRGY